MNVTKQFKEVGRYASNGEEMIILEASITLRIDVGVAIPEDVLESSLAKAVEGSLRAEADAIRSRTSSLL